MQGFIDALKDEMLTINVRNLKIGVWRRNIRNPNLSERDVTFDVDPILRSELNKFADVFKLRKVVFEAKNIKSKELIHYAIECKFIYRGNDFGDIPATGNMQVVLVMEGPAFPARCGKTELSIPQADISVYPVPVLWSNNPNINPPQRNGEEPSG